MELFREPSFPHVFSATALRTDQPQAEAGIHGTRMDPRLEHSGVTALEFQNVFQKPAVLRPTFQSGTQLFLEKCEDFFPTVHGLLLPVRRAVVVEETVSRAIVSVKFIILAVFLELRLVLVNLFG